MEDIKNDFLLKLLNHEELATEYLTHIKVASYLTLLSLNDNNYNEESHTQELNIIEDYLRKINNLKVKIQLKRKPEEIDNLLNEIKELTTSNSYIIRRYNKENMDIINVLETKDPKAITPLIDKLTKLKRNREEKKQYYQELRTLIINNHNNSLHITDDVLYFSNDITISLEDFYEVFDYLLSIDNYRDLYQNSESNNCRKTTINNIIESIMSNEPLNNEVIPIILTTIFKEVISSYENINMSKFNIDNIKITDLYSFADNNINNENNAKWRKISIPNDYLYLKIKDIVDKGMYYFKDTMFVLEYINNGTSDFKTSINISDMYEFLRENINSFNKTESKIKHV